MSAFDAVKVFSTTMARDREQMGERVTTWLKAHPEFTVVDRVMTQTSDQEFHCLTITLFLSGPVDRYLAEPAQTHARSNVVRPRPL